ncbi:unknown [Candidatus Colimorpha enterica]|uniref:Uncharacterized protein n=1 Tax=Candidatus Colimorpha enterica TaxID=3083063 RepID=R6U4P4_9BACT|nr:unknown [Candidatus Colimorpha enterica]
MTRADLAGVLCVILKILVVQKPVFISDKAVLRNAFRVEGYLELYVASDGVKGREQVGAEDLFRLGVGVDVVINSVSVVGNGFHVSVAVVSGAEAEDREVNSGSALFADEVLKLFGA